MVADLSVANLRVAALTIANLTVDNLTVVTLAVVACLQQVWQVCLECYKFDSCSLVVKLTVSNLPFSNWAKLLWLLLFDNFFYNCCKFDSYFINCCKFDSCCIDSKKFDSRLFDCWKFDSCFFNCCKMDSCKFDNCLNPVVLRHNNPISHFTNKHTHLTTQKQTQT